MRRIGRIKGCFGILIFVCLAFNLFAATHFPQIPMELLMTTDQQRIPENVLWHQILDYRNRTNCHDREANTTGISFHEKVDSFMKDQKSGGCFLPPSTSCNARKFSAVVYTIEQNTRNLFLTLMTLMSYGPVNDISWIGYAPDFELMPKDRKYKERIERWIAKGNINFISMNSSLWTAMQYLQPQSEAVVWIDGDRPKDFMLSSLKESLGVWRGDSRSIIASHIEKDDTCSFPLLHGLLLPRDYLCYLNHPLMKYFRETVQKEDLKRIPDSIALVFQVLADGYVSIPSVKKKGRIKKNRTQLDSFACTCTAKNSLSKSNKVCPT